MSHLNNQPPKQPDILKMSIVCEDFDCFLESIISTKNIVEPFERLRVNEQSFSKLSAQL